MSGPVLITGATGFIGAWIAARLIRQGVPVAASDISDDMSRLAALGADLPGRLAGLHRLDVTDASAVEALVAKVRPRAIIHLAALQIPQCRDNPGLGAMVNVVGHINIFEAARLHGVKRLIYTSSIAAKPRGPANAPANYYGVFKKTGEEIARLFWEDHGMASLGLRPHVVYGLGRDVGETSAITRAIEAAALGTDYTLPFRTETCFQYAGDVADIFARAALADWNGALLSDLSGTVESTDDLMAAIAEVVPEARVTLDGPHRLSPTDGFDTAPLESVIGPLGPTLLRQGVAESVAMFRQAAARVG